MHWKGSEPDAAVLDRDFDLEADFPWEFFIFEGKEAEGDDGFLELGTSFAYVLFKRGKYCNEIYQHSHNEWIELKLIETWTYFLIFYEASWSQIYEHQNIIKVAVKCLK